MRTAAVAAAVTVVVVLVAAGCGGGTEAPTLPKTAAPGTPGTSVTPGSGGDTVPTTASGPSSATTATSATTGTLSPPLPAPSTNGVLHVSATIPVPLPTGPVLAAEAPDGAVFVAQTNSPVYVVDGNLAAEVAEHVGGGPQALAADGASLYAASYTSSSTVVYSYSRASGAQTGQWTLPTVAVACLTRSTAGWNLQPNA